MRNAECGVKGEVVLSHSEVAIAVKLLSHLLAVKLCYRTVKLSSPSKN